MKSIAALSILFFMFTASALFAAAQLYFSGTFGVISKLLGPSNKVSGCWI